MKLRGALALGALAALLSGCGLTIPGWVPWLGSKPKPEPEWNIKSDIAAAKAVFASGLPLVVVPLDATGKAFARTRVVEWSPADGGFVHECPTDAITATNVDRRASQGAVTADQSRDPTPSGAGGD